MSESLGHLHLLPSVKKRGARVPGPVPPPSRSLTSHRKRCACGIRREQTTQNVISGGVCGLESQNLDALQATVRASRWVTPEPLHIIYERKAPRPRSPHEEFNARAASSCASWAGLAHNSPQVERKLVQLGGCRPVRSSKRSGGGTTYSKSGASVGFKCEESQDVAHPRPRRRIRVHTRRRWTHHRLVPQPSSRSRTDGQTKRKRQRRRTSS